MTEPEKKVDEAWKKRVRKEKGAASEPPKASAPETPAQAPQPAPESAPSAESVSTPTASSTSSSPPEPEPAPEARVLPTATFENFISAMAGQAIIYLGYAPNPVSGKRERNLPEAKYSIDLLQIIQDKTKGNLTPAEQSTLDGVLYDLRMRYINALR